MAVNIYDTANQLESDLRETDQFLKLKSSFENLQENEESKELYNQFRQIQQTLQQKQASGQEITEEDTQSAQELSTKVTEDPVLAELIEAEKEVGQMIDEINQIALKPVQELYQQNS